MGWDSMKSLPGPAHGARAHGPTIATTEANGVLNMAPQLRTCLQYHSTFHGTRDHLPFVGPAGTGLTQICNANIMTCLPPDLRRHRAEAITSP
jgi:hypothetical protein